MWLIPGCAPEPAVTPADTACTPLEWHTDVDGDGFGAAEVASYACNQPDGHVADGTDCDDGDPAAFPGAYESCDDADGDGYGSTDAVPACKASRIPCTDCNDADADVHPRTGERCDAVDNDCNGQVDESPAQGEQRWLRDADGDGYPPEGADELRACAPPEGYSAPPKNQGEDCDDTDAAIQPYGPEDCSDEVDQNCNGLLDDLCNDVTRSVADADSIFSSRDDTEEFATSPVALGDVTGDFLPDIGVQASAAPLATVYVFDGPSDGSVSTTDAIAVVHGDGERGINPPVAATVPDVDGDDFDDLAFLSSSTSTTVAWMFRGPFVGSVDPSQSWAQITGEPDLRLIYALGDVDADGLGDVAIAGNPDDGPFRVLTGIGAGEQALADFPGIVDDRSTTDWVLAVATLDNDGDGLDELVLRAGPSVVHVFQLPIADGCALSAADIVIATGGVDELDGGELIDGGDLSGDGAADLVVGAPAHEDERGSNGAVWIVTDLRVGDPGPDWQWGTLLGAEGAAVGSLLAAADIDGDARTDIVAGTYGFLAPGPGTVSTDDADLAVYGIADEAAAGLDLLIPGDTDGDGAEDLLFTSPYAVTDEGIGAAWLFRGGEWVRP